MKGAVALGVLAVLVSMVDYIGNSFVLTDSGTVKSSGIQDIWSSGSTVKSEENSADSDTRGKLAAMAQDGAGKSGRCLNRRISIRRICWNCWQTMRRQRILYWTIQKKKDDAPAENIGDITSGEIPLLLQWDERWGYAQYGDNMIAINGCGPTVVAMVAAGLTGDNTITPYRVAQYAEERGYYTGESGTSWELMTAGAEHFGVQGQELGLSENGILSELESGHPVICSMRPGDFTTTGHFIVLTGVEDGKIRVNDPNSRRRSETLWDYDTLEYQINNLWAFSTM